jgi:alpha-glucuronidase
MCLDLRVIDEVYRRSSEPRLHHRCQHRSGWKHVSTIYHPRRYSDHPCDKQRNLNKPA